MLSPYKFSETSPNFYEFITDYGIKFIFYFVDVSYYFETYPEITDEIYTFGFEPEASSENFYLNRDKRVELTVIDALRKFFIEKKNALIYVCDSGDGKQFLRKRKFDSWFKKYSLEDIEKYDGEVDEHGVKIPNSLILHSGNPHKEQILRAYYELNEELDK